MAAKGQSKAMSITEQICNVGSGFVVALLVWRLFVVPFLGISPNINDNLKVTAIFTVVSVVRGYVWRRTFNWIHGRDK